MAEIAVMERTEKAGNKAAGAVRPARAAEPMTAANAVDGTSALKVDCVPSNSPAKERVAAYCRVSTEQEQQQDSFENQVATYKERITSNPEWEFAGIYADEGISGTRAEKRMGFLKMIEDAHAGKFDRLLTKSISRFARNVVDSLKYTRELKALGISIEFEEEHLNSMDPGAEMIFTILSAVAEQESRNISEHTKWGIRNGYRRGEYRQTIFGLYGYRKGEDGKPVIVGNEAEVVRMIYKNYLDGMNSNEIAMNLNEMGILGKRGCEWQNGTVQSILENEKYKGDVYLQKGFVPNFMDHKTIKNEGQLEKYTLKDNHPAIVDRETWDAVQEEMERRSKVVDHNGLRSYAKKCNPYSGRIFMKYGCKALLHRHSYGRGATWKCKFYKKSYRTVCHNPLVIEGMAPKDYPDCEAMLINDKYIKKFFITAWNGMIDDDLKKRRAAWTEIRDSNTTTALQKVRAKQMLELTAGGAAAKMEEDVPEIVKMVLDRIEVVDQRYADVYFLDGTGIEVELEPEHAWE